MKHKLVKNVKSNVGIMDFTGKLNYKPQEVLCHRILFKLLKPSTKFGEALVP